MDDNVLADLPQVLTVAETVKALRSSESKVRRMLRTGKIAGVKLGRTWLVPKEEIVRLLTPVKLAGGRELTREQLESAGQKRLLEGSGRSGEVRYDAPGLKAPRIIG